MASEADYKDEAEGPRTTSPQSPYTKRQVGIGFLVLVIGIVVALLPVVLTAV